MSFQFELGAMIDQLDARKHAQEIARLKRCRRLEDLEALAVEGWILPSRAEPRLKLVRHGSGTFLVVQYVDGWSTALARQPFQGGRR